jgi:hypothetical protein
MSGKGSHVYNSRKIKAGAFERDGKAYRITPLDKD